MLLTSFNSHKISMLAAYVHVTISPLSFNVVATL